MTWAIIALAIAAGAAAWVITGRKTNAIAAPNHRPLPPGQDERGDKDEAIFNPTPKQLAPGDDVQLQRPSDHGPVTFSVLAAANIHDAEEPDDEWSEFEIEALEGDTRYWLVYSQDDDDRWGWTLHRKVGRAELDAMPIFDAMSYDGKKPPKQLEAFGKHWKVRRGSRHYDVRVTDWRIDRPKQHNYDARMTEYREVGGDATLGIELWQDGIAVSLAEDPVTNVTAIKRAQGRDA